ncbi:MAG: phosphatidate cytidylyltransferase [Deltaproteobacteria bacterium]|jgi:phosphatidate cytidylyltransferase|nr:phosphatidate cytidylyltransferase [Deltaproteobacteria bacterium]
MHLKRWITGLSALPLLIYIIVKGGLFFTLFVGLASLIAMWEYLRISQTARGGTAALVMKVVAYLYVPLIVGGAHQLSAESILNSVVICFCITGVASVLLFGNDPQIIDTTRKLLLGALYVPLLFSYLVLIRDGVAPGGAVWIFFVLVIVFAGDISALYVGTYFGKHKIYPALSPKKTIEGSLGGLGANLFCGALFKAIFLPELSWWTSLVFCLSLGVAGQIGDFFESGLKRGANIKDSGGILPGHGGILDRTDALMFAAPVAYLFKVHLF